MPNKHIKLFAVAHLDGQNTAALYAGRYVYEGESNDTNQVNRSAIYFPCIFIINRMFIRRSKFMHVVDTTGSAAGESKRC